MHLLFVSNFIGGNTKIALLVTTTDTSWSPCCSRQYRIFPHKSTSKLITLKMTKLIKDDAKSAKCDDKCELIVLVLLQEL